MNEGIRLANILKVHFDLNLARLKCMSFLIIAIIKTRTVNLTELSVAFPGKVHESSHYKRLQRFFREVEIDSALVAKIIAGLLPYYKFVLSIDRTNWKFGIININFLVLGIVHDGVAFPILWIFLEKQGNSNTKERIDLIDRFIEIFGLEKLDFLLGDREFIGKEWFEYLKVKKIKIRIRIKDNMLIDKMNSGSSPAKNFFRNQKIGVAKLLQGARKVCGHMLFITGMRLPSGEYLIVVSFDESDTVMDEYKKRWEIETLFQCLKTRGFRFEDTHMTEENKLTKLFSVLAMTFAWAYIVGEWRNARKPITIKKHKRREKSIFRYGLDALRQSFLNPTTFRKRINDLLDILKTAINIPKDVFC